VVGRGLLVDPRGEVGGDALGGVALGEREVSGDLEGDPRGGVEFGSLCKCGCGPLKVAVGDEPAGAGGCEGGTVGRSAGL
jgi:hypothetical protein